MRKIYNYLFILVFTATLAGVSASSLADSRHHESAYFSVNIGTPYPYYRSYHSYYFPAYYPHRYYYNPYPHYRHCEWAQGHFNHYGHWVPGHRICS